MPKDHSKVIGYFAVTPAYDLLCDGEACIIAGTQSNLNKYALEFRQKGLEFQNRKTTLGDILKGLEKGGYYAFDEVAYKKFRPLANKYGHSFTDEVFPKTEDGFQLVVVGP